MPAIPGVGAGWCPSTHLICFFLFGNDERFLDSCPLSPPCHLDAVSTSRVSYHAESAGGGAGATGGGAGTPALAAACALACAA